MAGYGTEVQFAQTYRAVTTFVGLVIKAGPGKLCRVVITATVTGSLIFNDNAAAAAGNLLWVSPANPTVGQIFDIMIPANLGIFCTPGSAGSFNVAFS